MEIYDAGYTNGYWIQRKTSCATSIVPDYFVSHSQLVLILNQPNFFFFIGINILYRYREWKKGNEERRNVVSVNKRCGFEFLVENGANCGESSSEFLLVWRSHFPPSFSTFFFLLRCFKTFARIRDYESGNLNWIDFIMDKSLFFFVN